MSNETLDELRQNAADILKGMQAVEARPEAWSITASEQWQEAHREFENLQQSIDQKELADVAEAGKAVDAAKAHLQGVIDSIKGDVPPELAAALQNLSRQTVATSADVASAKQAADTANLAANAGEGQKIFTDLMGAVGEGLAAGSAIVASASIPITQALVGFKDLGKFMNSEKINEALGDIGTGMKTLLAETANLKPESTARVTIREGEGPGSALATAPKQISQTTGMAM